MTRPDPHTAADYQALYRKASTRMASMSDADIIRYRRIQQQLSIRDRARLERTAR